MTDRHEEHRAWLAAFGFSERDWLRIKLLPSAMTPTYVPAALDDLDAPYRVGVADPDLPGGTSGQVLGSYDGKLLLVWPLLGHAREEWARRRRGS